MRTTRFVLALSILVGCGAAGIHDARPAAKPSIQTLSDQSSVAQSCDPAEHRLMRLSDGRIEPVLFCN